MKILVIDDSPLHQQSARQTLEGHDVTIVATYDEAVALFGLHAMPWRLKEWPQQEFDVVLADLMMPAGMAGLGGDGTQYNGQEMPMGFPLVLMAVLKSNAKYLAVVTDTNRHDHPAARALTLLIGYDEEVEHKLRPSFKINGAVVGFYNSTYQEFQVPIAGFDQPGKNWSAVLSNLLGE